MGRVIITCVFFCVLTSCSPFAINTMGYVAGKESLDEAWIVVSSFRFHAEPAGEDYWKSPAELEADGEGDCEDLAVYMVYLLGPEALMIGIHEPGIDHAIVKYKGKYLDPQRLGFYYNPAEIEILIEYDYWRLMSRVTRFGTKSIRYEVK